MSAAKMAAVVLIVLGVLGLSYGTFSYTKETHKAQLGPLALEVKNRETVNIPIWVGVGAVVAGGLILAFPRRRS